MTDPLSPRQNASHRNAEGCADPEQKTVIRVYAAFTASIFLGVVPHPLFAAMTAILFAGTLGAAYRIRRRAAANGLAENHMTYLIRTTWIMTALAAAAMLAAAGYFLMSYDDSALYRCADLIRGEAKAGDSQADMIGLCANDFVDDNMRTLLVAGLIGGAPVVAYLVYRLFRGLERALKGYRIARVKSWL